ncbi:hypothetical protein FSP39_011891 [Pinctada imbricata]|uniref:E3 ubiquitin-protein ligase TRAF7 n=1 Tax=Pinctada imbricata TaxID=66713 RepID=A0AA89BX93_PINIB|nr:hypothetical protein FSP39_011891 [Pinctada imbricata]
MLQPHESEDETPVVLVGELSPHLRCPICGKLYRDPVINIKCGHTFCRRCTLASTHCPEDGEHCNTSQLVVNRLVVGQVDDILIHCKHGVTKQNGVYVPDPTGCQVTVQIGKREEHEETCEFAPIACPNMVHCGKFRSSEMEQHLQVCAFHPCSHKDKGCEYMGRQDDIKDHLLSCGYRGLSKSVSLSDFNSHTRLLEEQNRDLRETVSLLTQRVEILEGQKNSVESKLDTCISTIQSLQKKQESLHLLVEQLMTTRNRRSMGSPGSSAEVVISPRSRSSSSSSLSGMKKSPPSTVKIENWKMPFQFKCIGTLRGHKNVVWCLATHKQKLYSAGADSVIKVWDLEALSKGCIKTMEGHKGVVHTMTVYKDLLITAGDDLSIRFWNLENLEEENCLENAHDNLISSMVVTSEYLFTASFSLIKIWDLSNLSLKHTISGLHHWVRAIILSPEKDLLYSGSHNTIDIWDATGTFNLKGKISHTFGSVYSLTLTPQYLIAGTYNRNIQVFDLSTRQHCKSLMGHVGTVQSLVTSSSGRFLFSCSVDCTMQIWNLENMLPIQTLQRHEGSVNTLILYGDCLLSGSEDREIKVYMHFQMQMGFGAQGVT